jgi:predicted alpha/beta-fold hydrolase
MMVKADFRPSRVLGNRHLQSVLATMPPRRALIQYRARQLREQSQELLVDCGDGVRLLAHFNAPTGPANGRLIVMIHGWEGSAESVYLLSVAPLLTQQGYTVIRLNLRDHGESHHLNEALFHSCRLAEVVGAMGWIQEHYADLRLSLVGYSLGGNFVLRVGAEASRAGLNIERIVALCPVLNPVQTMAALDGGWLGYRHYFLSKWRQSLLKKSAAFPEIYRFSRLQKFSTLEAMTDFFITRYTDFADLHSYLNGYALTGDRLKDLSASAVILLAEDDPVIPLAGLKDIYRPENLTVYHSLQGGHCGFLESLGPRSWLDNFILEQLAE